MRHEIRGVLAGTLMAVLAGTAAVALHSGEQRQSTSTVAIEPAPSVPLPPPAPAPARLTATASATATPLPVPPGAAFTDMAFTPDGRAGWVSGRYCAIGNPSHCGGFIYTTRNGGADWHLAYLGPVGLDHVGMSGGDRFGWAWGTSDPAGRGCLLAYTCTTSLLVTEDGGQSWRPVYWTSAQVTDVAFSGTAGLMGLRLCPAPSQPLRCTGQVLASADGGRTWHVAAAETQPIIAVAFGSGRAWAVASGMPDPRHTETFVLASTNGGRTWIRTGTIALPYPPAPTQAALAFTGQGVAWLTLFSLDSCAMHGCSTDAVYRSTDGGRSWTSVAVPVHPPTPPAYQPACGPYGLAQLAVGVGGYVFAVRSQNRAACGPRESTLSVSASGGSAWTLRSGWDQLFVRVTSWVSPRDGWVLGDHALLMTHDGGRTWTQGLPPVHPTAALDFVSATQGWGVGDPSDPGAVLATSDGGRRWTTLSSIPGARLSALSFANAQDGWVAGSVQSNGETGLWATDDGGHIWMPLGRQPGSQPVLDFTGPQHGVLVTVKDGVGTIHTTTDGGDTWAPGPDPPIPGGLIGGATFLKGGDAWAMAGSSLMHMTGAGSNWQTTDVNPNGSHTGLSFANADVGWVFSTTTKLVPIPGEKADLPVAEAAVFRTSDAGRSWQSVQLPRAMGKPTDIFGLSQRTAWLIAGGPDSDVTLWRSTDGGQSLGAAGMVTRHPPLSSSDQTPAAGGLPLRPTGARSAARCTGVRHAPLAP